MPKKTAKDREEELKIWESDPVYLTAEGLEKLKGRLEYLRKNLPEIVKEVSRTAAYGDRSENAEYKAAKSRLRSTQYQIASIEDQLRKIKVIPDSPDSNGEIKMGSTVKVLSRGEEKTFRIVGRSEADPSKGMISNESPLGKALIGRKAGEAIKFETQAGIQEYKVTEII